MQLRCSAMVSLCTLNSTTRVLENQLTTLPASFQSCGETYPLANCTCTNGSWNCNAVDTCVTPACVKETWDVETKTCAVARHEILEDYPGLDVTCVAEGTIVDLEYNINRVRIFVNATNRVVSPPRVG
jgi:hypothetical protein